MYIDVLAMLARVYRCIGDAGGDDGTCKVVCCRCALEQLYSETSTVRVGGKCENVFGSVNPKP